MFHKKPSFSRRLIYSAMLGRPTELEVLAEILVLIHSMGEYIKQRYGQEDFEKLLAYINGKDYDKDKADGTLYQTNHLAERIDTYKNYE